MINKVVGTNFKESGLSHAKTERCNFHFAVIYAFSQVCKVSDSITCMAFTVHL